MDNRQWSIEVRIERIKCCLRNRKRFRKTPTPWIFGPIQYIRSHLISGDRLCFITNWGIGKGAIDSSDERALGYIYETASILSCEAGAEFDLVLLLTDTHARLNNLKENLIKSYCVDMRKLTGNYSCISLKYLSEIILHSGVTTAELFLLLENSDLISLWDGVSDPLQKRLVEQAERYCRSEKAETCAQQYVAQSVYESAIITKYFGQVIYLAHQPPELYFLQPALPTIYTFLDPDRRSVKPWFNRDVLVS